MSTLPDFFAPEHALPFLDQAVARAYKLRTTYPAATFEIVASLVGTPRAVLDLGTGTGDVARPLAAFVDRVDAVDPSAAMIEEGQRLPGGDNERIHWIKGRAEDVALDGPYGLVTAGQSLHWMDWEQVMPRLAGTTLAVLTVIEPPPPWHDELMAIITRYTSNKGYQPIDLTGELAQRGHFTERGRRRTGTERVTRSVDDYVESFHGRSSLARPRLGRRAAEFDREIRTLVRRWHEDEVSLEVAGDVVWGDPR